MHMTIYRDDIVPVCGRCEGDGFHALGAEGSWASCSACHGTGIAPPPRRKWRDEVAGTLGCLPCIALFVVIYVMLP
ncbi:MAG: hypothetical protein ABL874_07330 [Sphingopyxis sp.]